MINLWVFIVTALTYCSAVPSVQEDCLCPQSTPQWFRRLFIDECIKYLNNEALNTTATDEYDCSQVWETFAEAFAHKDPATVTTDDYQPYFEQLPQGLTSNRDNSLFWSQTQELVEMLSCMCDSSMGADIQSSANIPSTAIINGIEKNLNIDQLCWCGTTDGSSPDGIEYMQQCPCSVSFAYFELFSRMFAKAAKGLVFYLGYGERDGGTFGNKSFFNRFEIPNLNNQEVTLATIIVVHRKGMGESCGEGTLLTLEQRLDERGINHRCYDVFGDLNDKSRLSTLTECALDIIESVQMGDELDDSSECFMSSAISGARVSFVLFAVAVLVAFKHTTP